MIDREEVDRYNAALAQRLRLARLRQAVCLEDIDYSTPRGLDRTLIRSLAAGRWLAEHNRATHKSCNSTRCPDANFALEKRVPW